MYNEFIKIKTNYISHANIYSTRNFGSIFFALFSGFCAFPPLWHGERFPLRLQAGNGRQFGVAALVRRKAFTSGDFDRFKSLFFRRVCRG